MAPNTRVRSVIHYNTQCETIKKNFITKLDPINLNLKYIM